MRIAIIGAGISGMTAAWFLHKEHDITVYEAEAKPGGHSNTVEFELAGQQHAVDTGFIVYNNHTYPNFIKLLDELKVPTQTAPMGFSVVNAARNLQYSSDVPNGLFAQRSNLVKPRFLRMVADIVRFMRNAPAVIDQQDSRPLGEYLDANGYSQAFKDDYLLPIGSAIWSAPLATLAEFPTDQFVHFFKNHGLLSVNGHLQWRTISGGSQEYVRRLTAPFAEQIRLSSPVQSVERQADHIVVTSNGQSEHYDHVIMACHSDQALAMLNKPSTAEQDVLGALPYQSNDTVLHHDASIMPSNRRAWSSWNYRIEAEHAPAALSYHMNALQGFESAEPVSVSLNQTASIDPNKILYQTTYWHPVYTPESVAARRRWDEISGRDRIHYCGAYWDFGFHEDGVRSGLRVVESINGAEQRTASALRPAA